MAAGPVPKPKEERRNTRKPLRGEWVDLERVTTELPSLPEGYEPRIYEIWDAWSRDPVSAEWEPADLDYALDTIELRATEWPRKADEVRRRCDALGLTPKGKRDLRWRVGGEQVAALTPKKASAGASKRRARLSLVS